MRMVPKIIKSSRFEDGTYTIKAAPFPPPDLLVAPDGPRSVAAAEEDLGPHVDPRVAAAEAEAETLVALARQEADALRQQAMAEAQAIREGALERGREEGHAEGLSLGRQEGEHAVRTELAGQLAQMAEAVAALDRAREAAQEAHAQELAKLAIVIAQKLLAIELGHGREAAVPLAEAALKHITDKTQVRLRVHPLDRDAILAAKQQLLLSVDGLAQLDVVADPAVGLGGCMVDTRSGMVDARLGTQLAEVAAAMLDVRAGVDEGGEMDPVVLAAIRALGRSGAVPAQVEAPKPMLQMESRVQRAVARPVTPVADPAAEAAAKAEAMLAAARAEADALLAQAHAAVASLPLDGRGRGAAGGGERSPEGGEGAAAEVLQPSPVLAPEPPHHAADGAAPVDADPLPLRGEGSPEAPAVERPDPSRRAAQALAARLGQLKAGKAVLSMEEELEIKRAEDGRKDAELEAIIRQAQLPKTAIGASESLVWTPPQLDDAVDKLAEKLGQKPKAKLVVPEGALEDTTIDQIISGVGMRPAGEDIVMAGDDAKAEPSIEKATDALAKMLGSKRKKSNRPWYEQI